MKKLLATAALVAGLASAPAALAEPAFITENSASQNQLHRTTVQPSPAFITENSATQNRISQPTVVTVAAHDGFDWADAGIGAAGAIGAMLLLLGGSVLVVRRREHSIASA